MNEPQEKKVECISEAYKVSNTIKVSTNQTRND
jgi:hypothetical protein